MRLVFSLPAGVLALTAMTGCNGVAGISDLITGDLDASFDASSEASGDDASNGIADGGAGLDSATNIDAGNIDAATVDAGFVDASADADLPPACAGTAVGLRINVAVSSQFTAVRDDGNGIVVLVGTTYSHCFTAGTEIQLQADPDTSNASHDWGTACVAGRRCAFTLVTAMTVNVKL